MIFTTLSLAVAKHGADALNVLYQFRFTNAVQDGQVYCVWQEKVIEIIQDFVDDVHCQIRAPA